MARKPARRTTYRSAPARRSYGSGSRARTSTRSRGSARKPQQRQQTVRVVIETLPASAVSRPEGAPLQKLAAPPKQSKF